MTVGDRIRKQRELSGMSQTELAERVKISKQTLYKYEMNVVTNVPSDKIESIARVLEVSPAFLMGWNAPSIDRAELLADIAGDHKLLGYIEKINKMDISDKEKIYSYIDYVVSIKK